MSLISNVGKAGVVTYGTQAMFQFAVSFLSPTAGRSVPFTTYTPMLATNAPTVGTIILAGVTITLVAADLLSPAAVAAKIKSNGVTSYKVGVDTYNPSIIRIVADAIGPITAPTIALGTATGIVFSDIQFTQGVLCATGDLDDIYVGGKTPLSLTLATTSATATVKYCAGTLLEQQLGTLAYNTTAITFTGGIASVTLPINFLRVSSSGITATSQIKLYINT